MLKDSYIGENRGQHTGFITFVCHHIEQIKNRWVMWNNWVVRHVPCRKRWGMGIPFWWSYTPKKAVSVCVSHEKQLVSRPECVSVPCRMRTALGRKGLYFHREAPSQNRSSWQRGALLWSHFFIYLTTILNGVTRGWSVSSSPSTRTAEASLIGRIQAD